MTEQEIIAIIDEVFEQTFEVEKERLTPESDIFLDLGLDSLDMVDLVVALQEKFPAKKMREDERLRQIRTLGDVYDFVITLSKEK